MRIQLPARRVLAVLVGLVAVAATLAGPSSAEAAGVPNPTPGVAVHFQYPVADSRHTSANQESVANTLESQFEAIAVHNGSTPWNVYITMFDLVSAKSSDVVGRLLTSIQNSQAIVHVVFDNHQAASNTKPTCSGAAVSTNKGGWTSAAARLYCIAVHSGGDFNRCTYSCIADSGHSIMHNKFVLFASRTDDQRIVMSSSANWTPVQLANYYQTIAVLRGTKAGSTNNNIFHQWYLYWRDLATHADHVPGIYTTSYVTSAFFPRSTDPELAELQKVDCARGGFIGLRSNNFDNPDLAEQLAAMRKKGCSVHVLATAHGIQHNYPGLDKHCVNNLHQKDLIIDAHYPGGTPDLSVWTGSRPFGPAFRSAADSDLRLRGQFWVDRFKTDFDQQFAQTTAHGRAACHY